MIVLGACDGDGERYWNLLGGGVEPGETLEDCLVREVMEEGCARVAGSRYIGCQRVDDPDHPTGPWRYYQARFWARVELLRWIRSTRSTSAAWSGLKTSSDPELGLCAQRRHHPCGRAQGRGRTQTGLTARGVRRRSPTDPVRENALTGRRGQGSADRMAATQRPHADFKSLPRVLLYCCCTWRRSVRKIVGTAGFEPATP